MKKIIIITAILLFAVSVHAQRTSRERTRHEPEKQKSETAVRRSAEQKNNSRSQQATRTRQASTRDISHANRTRTSSAKSHSNNRSGTSRSQTFKSTYEKPQQGRVSRRNTGNKGRSSGDRSPNSGHTGTYKGQKPSHNKGTTSSKHYTTPNRRAVRTNHAKAYHYNPVRYHKAHYHYRAPNRIHVTWTNRMYHDYRVMYPEYRYWYYPVGYQIVTIPFYNAYYHVGEVRNVYGMIHEVYYSWTTDEYHLYFGGNYPYHDFTVVIPGRHARRFDRYPEMFFEGRYMWVTGLLSTFDGRPELIVKRRHQIHLY